MVRRISDRPPVQRRLSRTERVLQQRQQQVARQREAARVAALPPTQEQLQVQEQRRIQEGIQTIENKKTIWQARLDNALVKQKQAAEAGDNEQQERFERTATDARQELSNLNRAAVNVRKGFTLQSSLAVASARSRTFVKSQQFKAIRKAQLKKQEAQPVSIPTQQVKEAKVDVFGFPIVDPLTQGGTVIREGISLPSDSPKTTLEKVRGKVQEVFPFISEFREKHPELFEPALKTVADLTPEELAFAQEKQQQIQERTFLQRALAGFPSKTGVPFVGIFEEAAVPIVDLGEKIAEGLEKTTVISRPTKGSEFLKSITVPRETAEELIATTLKFGFFSPALTTTTEVTAKLPKEVRVEFKGVEQKIAKGKVRTDVKFKTSKGEVGRAASITTELPAGTTSAQLSKTFGVGEFGLPRFDLFRGKFVLTRSKTFVGAKGSATIPRRLTVEVERSGLLFSKEVEGFVQASKGVVTTGRGVRFPSGKVKFDTSKFIGIGKGFKIDDRSFLVGLTRTEEGSLAFSKGIIDKIVKSADTFTITGAATGGGARTGATATSTALSQKAVSDTASIVQAAVSQTSKVSGVAGGVVLRIGTQAAAKIVTKPVIKQRPSAQPVLDTKALQKSDTIVNTALASAEKSIQGSAQRTKQKTRQQQRTGQVVLTKTLSKQAQQQKQILSQVSVLKFKTPQKLGLGFAPTFITPTIPKIPLFPIIPLFPKVRRKPTRIQKPRRRREFGFTPELLFRAFGDPGTLDLTEKQAAKLVGKVLVGTEFRPGIIIKKKKKKKKFKKGKKK